MRDEKCVINSIRESYREEAIWEARVLMGGQKNVFSRSRVCGCGLASSDSG